MISLVVSIYLLGERVVSASQDEYVPFLCDARSRGDVDSFAVLVPDAEYGWSHPEQCCTMPADCLLPLLLSFVLGFKRLHSL